MKDPNHDDILDLIDAETAGITDEDIEQRWQEFLPNRKLDDTVPPAILTDDVDTVIDALAAGRSAGQAVVFVYPCLGEFSPFRARGYAARLAHADVHPVHWRKGGDR